MNWDWVVALPILAFIALAAGLAVVFRRTGSIVAKARETEGFRSSVRDLASRIDASLEGASTRIDQVRHHELTPDAIGETLDDRIRCRGPLSRGGARAARALDRRSTSAMTWWRSSSEPAVPSRPSSTGPPS